MSDELARGSYRQTSRQTYTAAAHNRALDAVERRWERMHAAHLAGDEEGYKLGRSCSRGMRSAGSRAFPGAIAVGELGGRG